MFASLYVGTSMVLWMDLRGTPALWILGSLDKGNATVTLNTNYYKGKTIAY